MKHKVTSKDKLPTHPHVPIMISKHIGTPYTFLVSQSSLSWDPKTMGPYLAYEALSRAPISNHLFRSKYIVSIAPLRWLLLAIIKC